MGSLGTAARSSLSLPQLEETHIATKTEQPEGKQASKRELSTKIPIMLKLTTLT